MVLFCSGSGGSIVAILFCQGPGNNGGVRMRLMKLRWWLFSPGRGILSAGKDIVAFPL